MISGIQHHLVNNPIINNKEQKNSANTTRAKLVVAPNLRGSANPDLIRLKLISLGYPCR